MKDYSVPIPVYFVSKKFGYGIFEVALGCLLISLLILYAQWHWGRKKLYVAAAKRKGPFPWPFVGSAFRFLGTNEEILYSFVTLYEEYASPVPIWLGHRLFFGCNKPEDLEIVLTSPKSMEKEDLYKFAAVYLGNGLFTAPVPLWKKHRKLISPTLSQVTLDSFVPIFSENAKILVEVLKEDLKTTKNGALDISDRISKCSFDTICETAMGQEMNTQKSDNDLGHAIDRGMEIVFKRMFKLWFHFDFIFNLTKLATEQKAILDRLNRLTNKVIVKKKEEYQAKQNELAENPEAEVDSERMKARKIFLDHLIAQSVFTDEELRDQTLTFLLGGSDTSGTILSFVMVCLGMHQDVQQKAYEEVMDVIGPNRDVEVHDLPKLKYVETVIKETMRFFPIGANIVRKITDDLKLSNNVVLPAGSSAIVSIFHLHHNEEYWPDPWKFDPDRFLPEVAAKRHPYAYLAFSGGPRNCIGFRYAYMSMKTIVANIVRAFRFESDYKDMHSVRCQQDIIIKSAVGYKVRLYER